jgi:hypothetical protein
MFDDAKKHWLLAGIIAVVAIIILDLWQTATQFGNSIKDLAKLFVAFFVVFVSFAASTEATVCIFFAFIGLSILNHLFGWFSSSSNGSYQMGSTNLDWIQSIENTISTSSTSNNFGQGSGSTFNTGTGTSGNGGYIGGGSQTGGYSGAQTNDFPPNFAGPSTTTQT